MSGVAVTAKVLARGQVTLPSVVRREAGVRPGDLVTVRVTGPGTLEVRVLRGLTPHELFERYRIEGEIDEAVDREAWQAEAAKDVFGSHSG
jgi:AbrB family looped-hinge helix DNA binding protein